MNFVKCPNCNGLLTKDMCDVKMCFNCGEALDEIQIDEKLLQQIKKQEEDILATEKEMQDKLKKYLAREIAVTTGDLKQEYEIIRPVYFQLSNKGIFSSTYSLLEKQYKTQIEQMKNNQMISQEKTDWGFLYGAYSVGQNEFEKAFFIATEELKKRAKILGADAIICMRQDIDLDTNNLQFFYLQMYGTAVKYI